MRLLLLPSAQQQHRMSLKGCRYSVYIESRAYVSNLRQKLVCGSPLLAPRMHHYEWYSRALVPGTHFVQVALTIGPDSL
jgi:Glycosyl transferase family 90